VRLKAAAAIGLLLIGLTGWASAAPVLSAHETLPFSDSSALQPVTSLTLGGPLTGEPFVDPSLPSSVPLHQAPEPAQAPINLPPVPSALLMAAFGCLCVMLFRGRRVCAAVIVSVVSVCATGLGALPRLMAALHGRHVAHIPVSAPVGPDADRSSYVSADADLDFIGLLRRLGTEGGSDAARPGLPALVNPLPFAPAVGSLVTAQLAAGSHCRVSSWDTAPPAFPSGAAVEPSLISALAPRPAVSRPSAPFIPHPLLARPPPLLN
jgi:hypothetical protein